MIEAIRALVRPIATLAVLGAFIYGFVMGMIEVGLFVPVVSMVVAFWFGSRTGGNGSHT